MTGAAAGLFLTLSFPEQTDEAKLLEEARKRGVMLDGSEHASTPQPPAVAFGFSGGPEPALRHAVKLLAAAGISG